MATSELSAVSVAEITSLSPSPSTSRTLSNYENYTSAFGLLAGIEYGTGEIWGSGSGILEGPRLLSDAEVHVHSGTTSSRSSMITIKSGSLFYSVSQT
ncbi:hypothetical protein Pelo_14745 [Pelomyxa schiedti]|nr:hypothetical protein Pelo_14745 [Pelomyxa schiedti]